MFRALAATATISLANAALTAEFMQGAQTAIFLAKEEDFADYSCPEPEMSEDIERYINMIEPLKAMFAPKPARRNSRNSNLNQEDEE